MEHTVVRRLFSATAPDFCSRESGLVFDGAGRHRNRSVCIWLIWSVIGWIDRTSWFADAFLWL